MKETTELETFVFFFSFPFLLLLFLFVFFFFFFKMMFSVFFCFFFPLPNSSYSIEPWMHTSGLFRSTPSSVFYLVQPVAFSSDLVPHFVSYHCPIYFGFFIA